VIKPASWIQAIFSVALLGVLFFWIDPEDLFVSFGHVDPVFLFSAAALLPMNMGLGMLIWGILVRTLEPEAPTRSIVSSVLAGYTLGFFTPARVGELLARYSHHTGYGAVRLTVAYATEGLFRISVATLAGGVALSILANQDVFSGTGWSFVSIGTLLLGITLSALAVGVVSYERLPMPRALKDKWSPIQRLSTVRAVRIWMLVLTRYTIALTQFSLVLLGTGMSVSRLMAAAGASFTLLTKTWAPGLFLMDLGVREGAAAYVFERMAGAGAAATVAALCVFGINVVLPAIVGIPFVLKKKRTS